MTLVLDDETIRDVFEWSAAIKALRDAYSGDVAGSRYPERTMARGNQSWLRSLTGVSADAGVMGAKLIAVSLKAQAASYLIPLFDEQTAELVALLDGQSVTGFRTAATSALAADLLAPEGPLELAVIGSGFEAKNHVRALAAARPLSSVRVWSPRAESRARFIAELADLGLTITAADNAGDAVVSANVTLCAARSRDETPVLHGAWLTPGSTVISIGSTLPEQREVDSDVWARADLVVADMVAEVLHDTGDALAAIADGVEIASKTVALADVVSGAISGRRHHSDIVVYKSVGSAVQDIAIASMSLRLARARGLGAELPVMFPPVQK
ncbi:ornithine cyclodeaminase family protein [Mycolicibacterium sp. CBMA 226]|uniref:ornithine cyclodeaminase family protein n=1 Tax=Mycolicibacterium sp. CBMA 226 TaxID=2606611 RepID=UPI0012DC9B06|nr:ornithine cyclodeaminase family protein [Mycolicibacterium sp. CBMA 226]MUL79011.1 ornithine cyclodeaminase family protein [Mycolicibacterium sp. CBMA 226]